MIEIKILGAGREVGRSSILVDTGAEKILMDYGVDVQHNLAPIQPETRLDNVFITHAHLDHSGVVPELYKRGYDGPVTATRPTFDLMEILLKDSIKVQDRKGENPHFDINDLRKMEKNRNVLEPGQRQEMTLSTAEFVHAGHIPGSAMVLIESRGKRILYTGDVNFIDTELMKGASQNIKDIDVLITEATYSYTDHPPRKGLEDRLREIVTETVNRNGLAVIPSFAVGRTQELLMVLNGLEIPLHIDGMGIRATERILNHQDSVRDYKLLEKAYGRAIKIKKERDRNRILQTAGAVLTTSGMLNGGPVAHYIAALFARPECSLTMTGYQVAGTAGRNLMDTGRYVLEDVDVKPKMRVDFLDFSAHTDRSHLLKFFKNISPEKIVLVHSDHTEKFSEELKGMGYDAVNPMNGETIKIS